MSQSRQFKADEMNGLSKVTEKVHYKGQLRIIGQVVQDTNSKETLGYVIMVEKNYTFKMYTVPQTKSLLQKFKFVNAEYDESRDKIVNTECSMEKIMKFDTQMHVIDNFGVIILGEVFSDNKTVGYRAMDCNAKVVDLLEEDLLKLNAHGTSILNAKIVNRGNSQHISAIKTEFTKIEKSQLKNFKPECNKKRDYIYELHRNKVMRRVVPGVFSKMCYVYDERRKVPELLPAYMTVRKDGKVYPLREAAIIAKEILPKYKLSSSDMDLLKDIVKTYVSKMTESTLSVELKQDILGLTLVAQFCLYDDAIFKATLNKLTYKRLRGIENGSILHEIISNGLACDKLKLLVQNMNKMLKAKELDELKKEEAFNSKLFNTISFKKAEDIAQIGFAVMRANKDYAYDTKTGGYYKLKYIGDYFNSVGKGYEEYKTMANCFGDLAVIAQIEKTLSVEYFDDYEVFTRVEVMLAILSMFRPDICKKYMEDRSDAWGYNEFIPNVNLDEQTDYSLSPELRIYYESGFNVFLNDSGHTACGEFAPKYYKKRALKKAKFINYRSLGNSVKIRHDMLYDELASVVNLITSDSCSPDMVKKVIGNLRVL